MIGHRLTMSHQCTGPACVSTGTPFFSFSQPETSGHHDARIHEVKHFAQPIHQEILVVFSGYLHLSGRVLGIGGFGKRCQSHGGVLEKFRQRCAPGAKSYIGGVFEDFEDSRHHLNGIDQSKHFAIRQYGEVLLHQRDHTSRASLPLSAWLRSIIDPPPAHVVKAGHTVTQHEPRA
jgi:hypothetical protein